MEHWDVVVVGGGPAGAACAAAARRAAPAARVLVLDRADFPRDKVCGDGIAPEALDVLAGLGLDPAALTDGYPAGRAAAAALPGRGDGRAARCTGRRASSPARCSTTGCSPRRSPPARSSAGTPCAGSTVHPDARGRRRRAHGAGVVVGADGAESVVRRALGIAPNRPDRLALAIRGYAAEPAAHAGVQSLLTTEQRWPAYAWSFPLGDDGRANVGYGELVSGGGHPGRPARRARPAAAGRRAERPAGAPAAAVDRPAAPARRAGAARRRRRLADQPAHRRGHLLRGALRCAGRAGRACTARRRAPTTGGRSTSGWAATCATRHSRRG